MIKLLALVAALLLASVPASATVAYPGPVPPHPVPASDWWPEGGRCTDDCGSVYEYRLTAAYWAAFKACRATRSHQHCYHTVPADYTVVRVK